MRKRKFKIGDIVSPNDGNQWIQYHISGINENLEYYKVSESPTFGISFCDEDKWERIDNEPLLARYETLANDYLNEFIRQTGIEEDAPFWVGNEIGGIACVADYFVDYTDIRYVVDGSISFDFFDEWYCYSSNVKMIDDSLFTPTLKQWCYGEFTRISDERLEELKQAKKHFEQLVQEEKEKQK